MASFKRLNRSDVISVPYVANKNWVFEYCPYPENDQYIKIYKGTNVTGSFSLDLDPVTEGQYERLVYSQINHLFYQNFTSSLSTSSLESSLYYDAMTQTRATHSYFNYNDNPLLIKTFPTGAMEGIRVLSINQDLYGQQLLPYHFELSSSAYYIKDDGMGNLIDYKNSNVQIGNIFYSHGLVTITNQNYQLMFPVPPLAHYKEVNYLDTDTNRIINLSSSVDGRGGIINTGSLVLSDYNYSLFTNNNNGTTTFSNVGLGTYQTHFTFDAILSGSNCSDRTLTSNKGLLKINVANNCAFSVTVVENPFPTPAPTTAPTTPPTTPPTTAPTAAPSTTSAPTTPPTTPPTTAPTAAPTTPAPTSAPTTPAPTTPPPTSPPTSAPVLPTYAYYFDLISPDTINLGGGTMVLNGGGTFTTNYTKTSTSTSYIPVGSSITADAGNNIQKIERYDYLGSLAYTKTMGSGVTSYTVDDYNLSMTANGTPASESPKLKVYFISVSTPAPTTPPPTIAPTPAPIPPRYSVTIQNNYDTGNTGYTELYQDTAGNGIFNLVATVSDGSFYSNTSFGSGDRFYCIAYHTSRSTTSQRGQIATQDNGTDLYGVQSTSAGTLPQSVTSTTTTGVVYHTYDVTVTFGNQI